ncbi:hypothetical protein PR002_g2191 [Phytophthora rubi]|uniref:Uncharacterized protein n=1 Tax=Phytophthora rubi TaxID=129364 RepID=A0A6A3NJ35_9STRA|nr:hypothetical protein PR002_g2191 [Phytophthora rubi]
MDALLELELPDAEVDGDGFFEVLVDVNQRWLGRYARLHPSFSMEPALLARNSLWLNAFFQKRRMATSAPSAERIRSALDKNSCDTHAASLAPTPLHKLRAATAHSHLSGRAFAHTDRFYFGVDAVMRGAGHGSASVFDNPLLGTAESAHTGGHAQRPRACCDDQDPSLSR